MGIINSVLILMMSQETLISVGNIGGLPSIPHLVLSYVSFCR